MLLNYNLAPFAKLMIATDFNVIAEKATNYGLKLAQRFSATVDIIHVLDDSLIGPPEQPTRPALADTRKTCLQKMERIWDRFSLAGLQCRTACLDGHPPAAVLLNFLQNHPMDLIITGTESRTNLGIPMLGSTAEQMIRSGQRPVLTVGRQSKPSPDTPFLFRTIVYATDFHPEAKRALPYALKLAQGSNGLLYACHFIGAQDPRVAGSELVEEATRRELKQLIAEAADEHCHPEVIVKRGEPATSILELCQDVQADLLVLGARAASALVTHIHRGLTPQLLATLSCPLLTVP